MALRFHSFIPYAIPGVLALLGCWWIYSWRKKHSGYCSKQAIAIEGEKQEEVSESDSCPKPEACTPRRLPLLSEEKFLEKPAPPTTPSLLHPAHERPDLSWEPPDLSATTAGPSPREDDSEKLESVGSREGSDIPAPASLPLLSGSTECDQNAVLSHVLGQGSGANQGQQPSLTRESLGVTEDISSTEQSDESSCKPPKEKQMPGIVQSDTGSVTACCLGLEKEASAPEAFLNEAEVVSGHEDSAVSVLPGNLESTCPKQCREEEMSESITGTIPMCQKDTQPKGDELEREKIGGVSLDKEVEKMEQVAIQIISKVILAATEEVLSGSAGDASPWLCQVPASRAEAPLGMESVAASAQVPVEGATAADESLAAGSGAEEQGQGVTDCSSHGCRASPVQGNTEDCQAKSWVCRESQGVGRTRVENSLEKSPLSMEDSGYGTQTPGGGTSAEEPLQSTVLSVTSDQHSDSLSTSSAPDTSAEQSSVPRETPCAPGLSKGSTVPYSNGILKEDGPDLSQECSSAPGTDGDHSEGSDVNSVDFVDSGSAMRKTVARQNAKLEGGSSKPDFVIWEIEVPKELVGRLIGKQGRFMSYLRQASGAKIYVSTLPYLRDSQVCHIEGTSHQVEKVLSLIGKKFKELCLTNIYSLPPPMPLHSLLVSAWLFLPDGVTVEVVVAHQVDAGHMFLQQHTHPTFHVLCSLNQQMFACYSQPEIPTLPTPVEVGIICAAPGLDGAWLRAQVISYFEETDEVELKYVDYGGYDKVKVDTLRQIRSDFLTLPFQAAEVLLDNVVPLPDEDHFSPEADATVSEMTRGAVLVAQVSSYDSVTGLPLIQLWNLMGDEVVSINRTLVERGFARWLDY
ncbi:A-kinase anchor protein 1, mitochondrial [Taeniopygia guttata]|uniref:A-kinase anchor protein 1, mitochondrial n=1 Tax=Taeniopygia guttata TaxID=59729 RepID=UPI003BB86543